MKIKKKKISKAILIFFAVMVCCTFIAKQTSAMTIARVDTEKMKGGSLVKKIEGTGEIQAADKSFQSLPEGQKVAEVLVKAGAEVKKGEAVVKLDMDYLNRQIAEQTREVEKAELDLKQQRLTAKHEQDQTDASAKEGEEQTDQTTDEEKAYQKQLASLQEESLQLTLQSQREKLKRLEKLKEADGTISSDYSGVLESVGATEGVVTTGSEQIILESGSLEVCGVIPDHAVGNLKEGSEVRVLAVGDTEEMKITVERFGTNEEGESLWYGKLPEQEIEKTYRSKTDVTYTYSENTVGSYENVVPLRALREEQNATYVLTAKVCSGILGEEYTAVKVPVKVIDKDEEHAAVQTSLPADALIISGSDKYVEDGDKVRLDG